MFTIRKCQWISFFDSNVFDSLVSVIPIVYMCLYYLNKLSLFIQNIFLLLESDDCESVKSDKSVGRYKRTVVVCIGNAQEFL